jgi:hypothetical protein
MSGEPPEEEEKRIHPTPKSSSYNLVRVPASNNMPRHVSRGSEILQPCDSVSAP